MSVALKSKSGEGEEDVVNLMAPYDTLKYGWRSRISGFLCGSLWWIGGAVLFLLLILILGVVAHNSTAIGQRDSKRENLIYSLMTDKDTLRDERSQLRINSTYLTKEMTELQSQNKVLQSQNGVLQNQTKELQSQNGVLQSQNGALQNQNKELQSQNGALQNQNKELQNQNGVLQNQNKELQNQNGVLQSQYNATAESRDKLQEEINRLNVNKTVKTCFTGWKIFEDKCYYFSTVGVTKTWESSRKDCKERGADLAIITSKEELNFVSKVYGVTWIGLSDKQQENKWKWVDGSDLVGDDYWQDGEPNNSDGNEDCAEVSRSAKRFNDVPCDRKFSWACEM